MLALLLLGYSHDQIGKATGNSVPGAQKISKRIRDEYKRIQDERDALSSLFQYL